MDADYTRTSGIAITTTFWTPEPKLVTQKLQTLVLNMDISTTLHMYSSLVFISDYFPGCLFYSTDVPEYHQKAPEEVVGHTWIRESSICAV